MGLGNSQHAVYLQIVDGKIARRYKVEMPGLTKARTNSVGKIIHEQFFDHLSGYIADIQRQPNKDPKFGDSLVITIVDGEDRYLLQTMIDSGYARAFLRLLPNVDFSKRTTLIPSMKLEDGGHKKVTLFVTQQGVSGGLKHHFTFNDPKGMPPAKEREWKGKTEYDYTAQIKFLFDYFEQNLRPKLKGTSATLQDIPQNKPANATPDKSSLSISDADYDDDLPF